MSFLRWVFLGGAGLGLYLLFTRFSLLDIFAAAFAVGVMVFCGWFAYNIYKVNSHG